MAPNLRPLIAARCFIHVSGVSQWGHDFRPKYMELAKLFESVSDGKRVPVMALTATATSLVRREIVTRLGLGKNGGPMHTLVNRWDLKIPQSFALGMESPRMQPPEYFRVLGPGAIVGLESNILGF